MLNTDDESSLDQPPKSKGRGKGQSGIQGATKGTRTLSGETNLAVDSYLLLLNVRICRR